MRSPLSMPVVVAGALALVLPSSTVTSAPLPVYPVPSFEYPSLSSASKSSTGSGSGSESAHALLAALQLDGVVSLRNVPGYASLRREYLARAAACAVHAKDQDLAFLLHRRLQDGTQRYTISSEAGRQLASAPSDALAACPGYQESYYAFSRAVENAVATVGRALDATQQLQFTRAAQELPSAVALTARSLMEESVHLDHFHAYEAARPLRRLDALEQEQEQPPLSLEMHTDNGLLIAMAAPAYFTVTEAGDVLPQDSTSHDAGLIIQTAAGKAVRPMLQEDELVLMLGEGVAQWLATSPKLHAVSHAMQYPRALAFTDDAHRSLRTWFGKMILLPEHQVMHNTGLTYGEYANRTTRYLHEEEEEEGEGAKGWAAVACPRQRRLVASDNKCTLKICKPKASAGDKIKSCQTTCNHNSLLDATNCASYCDCEDAKQDATSCWMLCVPHLPKSECAGEQKCNDAFVEKDLAMTCVAGGGGGGGGSGGGDNNEPTATPSSSPSSEPSSEPSDSPTSSPPDSVPDETTSPTEGSTGNQASNAPSALASDNGSEGDDTSSSEGSGPEELAVDASGSDATPEPSAAHGARSLASISISISIAVSLLIVCVQ